MAMMITKTTMTTIEIEFDAGSCAAFGEEKLTPTLTFRARPAEISCRLSPE
jgi:hypothetical protein